MSCPRRSESFHQHSDPEKDNFECGHCSYCGSLDPEVFLARLEAGDIELVPTDKSYKVYVKNVGGARFTQRFRNCPMSSGCKDPDECTHWAIREIGETKFYFQHLTKAQMDRFIELYNENKVKLGYPGHFYVLPFFTARSKENPA